MAFVNVFLLDHKYTKVRHIQVIAASGLSCDCPSKQHLLFWYINNLSTSHVQGTIEPELE